MPRNIVIGEFEQLVLLSLLQTEEPYALALRQKLDSVVRRKVSRGGLYATLDRLEDKGFIGWELEDEGPDRGGHARRKFHVTDSGIAALRESRRALLSLWTGLEELLG